MFSANELNEIKKAFANACAILKTKEFDHLMDELNCGNEEFYKMEEDQAQAEEDQYYNGYTVYKDNGIEIIAQPSDVSYRFETSKYSVIWYTGGGISIYNSKSSIYNSKFILDVKFKFDLCYFVKGQFLGDHKGYNIEYCSDEYFHSKLNRFLNLKAFF